MKRGELPRAYYFYQGLHEAYAESRVVLPGNRPVSSRDTLTRREALQLVHIRAHNYKVPFMISIDPGSLSPGGVYALVTLIGCTSFSWDEPTKRYRYENRAKIGWGPNSNNKQFATASELLQYFEDRMVRFFTGDTDAL